MKTKIKIMNQKEFIKDLAEEIKKLESERKEKEQAEDLPF